MTMGKTKVNIVINGKSATLPWGTLPSEYINFGFPSLTSKFHRPGYDDKYHSRSYLEAIY